MPTKESFARSGEGREQDLEEVYVGGRCVVEVAKGEKR